MFKELRYMYYVLCIFRIGEDVKQMGLFKANNRADNCFSSSSI